MKDRVQSSLRNSYYYERGSEEAVSETALTINRLEQVSRSKLPSWWGKFNSLPNVHVKDERHAGVFFSHALLAREN